jgi:hypothetical protein
MTNSFIPGLQPQHNDREHQAEQDAELAAVTLMCTVSFVQTAQNKGVAPSREILDRQGRATTVPASSISNKRLVEKFLAQQGFAGLCSLSLIREQALAKAYSEWLRARKGSKYALIDDPDGIEWLENICGLALVERVVWNKRDQNAFMDANAAMKAETAFQLRQNRGFMNEAAQHVIKHKLNSEEAAEYMHAVYERQIKAIEEHQQQIGLLLLNEPPKEASHE